MTAATIEEMIDDTIGKEGDFSDHPADRGGPTRWGITEQVARANGYRGEMRDFPRGTAFAIYRQVYAIAPGFVRVAEISPAVAAELFDTGVNMGPTVPALWFQQWLNALNQQGKDYADIPEDADQPKGGIGPRTLDAFKALRAKRGAAAADAVMLKGLNSDQGARYKVLARNRTANEAFVFGWLANRVGL